MTMLDELLNTPINGDRFRVLGGAAAARVPVSQIKLITAESQEAPTIGELVVVFGSTNQQWWWDALVHRVREREAAGIIVPTLPPDFGGMSRSALDLAARLGVTVGVLEGNQHDLLEFAARSRLYLQTPNLRDAEIFSALQQTQGQAHPESMRAVVERLSVLLGSETWLGAENGPLLAHTGGLRAVPQQALAEFKADSTLVSAERMLYLRQGFRSGSQRYLLGTSLPADVPGHVVRQAERALSIGALYAARWYAELQLSGQVLSSARNALLDQAFAGTHPMKSLEQRAADLDLPLSGWNLAFFIVAETRLSGLGEMLSDALQAVPPKTALLPREGGWAGWVHFSAAPSAARLRESVRKLRDAYRRTAHHAEISMGVGRTGEGVEHLQRSLAEARDAAQLAQTKPVGRRFVQVDGLGASRLLLAWTESAPFLPRAKSLLEPLDELGPEYRQTLLAYLDSSCSSVEAARILGTHRNTMRVRIDRIRERLSVDLDNPDERLALHLALRTTERGGN